MKKVILLLTAALTITACSKEEMDLVTPVTTTQTQTAEVWGDWSPAFTNQTSDFTQSRTSDKNNTENRTVSVSVISADVNERQDGVDINNDGDIVDYYAIHSYSASIGGTHEVVQLTTNQESNFLTRNYGVWSNQLNGQLLPFTVTVGSVYSDAGDEYESEAVIGWHILDDVINSYTAADLNSCFTLSSFEGNIDGVEYFTLNEDAIEFAIYGVSVFDMFDVDYATQLAAQLNAAGLPAKLDIFNSFGVEDYDNVSAINMGQAVYISGTEYDLFLNRGSLVYFGDLDVSEYTCGNTGKSVAPKFMKGINIDSDLTIK